MILAISSSSPLSSVAVIGLEGAVMASQDRMAHRAASTALCDLFQSVMGECGLQNSDLTSIAVDVGPGGFTSVRVGVTFAKVLAWSLGILVRPVSSFDLISVEKDVAFPSKRGEWFCRKLNREPERIVTLDKFQGVGYGLGSDQDCYPLAARVATLLPTLQPIDPAILNPTYLAEPSISTPKKSHVLPKGGATV